MAEIGQTDEPKKAPAKARRGRPWGTTKDILRAKERLAAPIAQPKPYDGVPYMVERLMALRPGETLRYYRGTADDLDRDLTPLHNAILHQVFACAARLQERGKVQLRETPVKVKTGLSVVDFTATGLR
jgi:hypothetical protein